MNYDADANIISIELGRDAIFDTKVAGTVLIHVSKIGKPVFIEILNASKLLGVKNQLPSFEQLQKLVPEL